MKKYIGIKHLPLLVSASLLTACVGVDICEEAEHPHQAVLQVQYNWPSTATSEETSKTWIIASRPYITTKYDFGWFAQENIGCEIGYLSPDENDTIKSSYFNQDSISWFTREAVEEDATEQKVRVGRYSMMTVSAYPYMHFDSLDVFMSQSNASMDMIGIHYDTWTRPEEVDSAFVHWVDFNTTYPYVKDEGVIYYDEQIVDAETGEVAMVNFAPMPLSQQLTFQLNVARNSEELIVDSVQAEISGVVVAKKLRTGYLDMEGAHTARMIFPLSVKSSSGNTFACEGSVNVLGLMGPANDEMQTGPGILHLAVYTHRFNDRGEQENRTYLWGINLYHTLHEHPVTLRTPDMQHHVMTSAAETLQVMVNLLMRIEDFHNEDDIYHWEKEDPNDVDVEY